MAKEKEAEDGKSLEEPNLVAELEAHYDELEADEEKQEPKDEKQAEQEAESDSDSPADDPDTPDDADTEEEDFGDGEDNTEGAETVTTIEEHLPLDFKEAVEGIEDDKLKIILDTVKTSESRANEKFEESSEARKFSEAIGFDGVKTYAQQMGTTPEGYFNALRQIEQGFKNNPIDTTLYMMQQAGINNAEGIAKLQSKLGLTQTEETYSDPDLKAVLDKVSGLESKLAQNENNRVQQQSQEANATIEAFKNESSDGQPAHPHFEKVRDTMGSLMNGGQARNMAEAYDKAIRLDDELYKGILKENQESVVKSKEEKRKQSVLKSKAASRNVTGKKPSQTEKDYPEDMVEHLRQKYDELNAE